MPSLPDGSPRAANPAEAVPADPPSTSSTELVAIARAATSALPALPTVQLSDVYGGLLADSRCENTRLQRVQAVESFRRFLDAASPQDAIAAFLAAGRGMANALALAFRNHEAARGMAAATVNVRLATLRRAVRIGRRLDVIDFQIDIDDLPNSHEADRRGPGVDGFKALWAAAVAHGDNPDGLQVRALLAVLYHNALRKTEAIMLDLAHVHLDRRPPALHIMGKGKKGRQFVTLNEATALALRKWIEARGDDPGPLFVTQPTRVTNYLPLAPYVPSFCAHLVPLVTKYVREGATNAQIAERLTRAGHVRQRGSAWKAKAVCQYFGTARLRRPERYTEAVMMSTHVTRIHDKSVNRLIHQLAREAGLPFVVRPHGLRHASITRALDLTNGDIRKVQRFGRHQSPATTMRYDDCRKDLAGEVARMIGDDIGND